MTQATFNRVVTVVLFAYFLIMYTVSWWIGKPLDFISALVLAVPTINHIIHQLTDTSIHTANINKDKEVEVAKITSKNGENGV